MGKIQLVNIGLVPEIVAESGRPLASAYAQFLQSERFDPSTRQAYRSAIDQFFLFCSQTGTRIQQVAPSHAAAYFTGALASKSPSTQRLGLSALRALFREFAGRQLIADNPFQHVRLPKGVRAQRTRYDDAGGARSKLNQLLKAIDGSSPSDHRDKALITTLCLGFVKLDAVLRLRYADYVTEKGQAWLRFAKSDSRYVDIPCHRLLHENIDAHTEHWPHHTTDALFQARVHRVSTPFSRVHAWRIVAKRVEQAGLSGINCRTLNNWGIALLLDAFKLPQGLTALVPARSSLRATLFHSRSPRPLSPDIVDRIQL
jgi:site-specific recombinase XerD